MIAGSDDALVQAAVRLKSYRGQPQCTLRLFLNGEYCLVTGIDSHGAQSAAGHPRYFRPELDVVRFLAFFLVLLHHVFIPDAKPDWPHYELITGLTNAFGFGLALFFTLSAFLICELLLREKSRTATIDLRSFYLRRILRIWPLYFLGLSIGCGLALLWHQYQDLPLFGAYALMIGNWFIIFVHFTGNPMDVLWSISIEEQFYLFAPLTVRLLSRRSLYGLCAGLILVANAALFVLGSRHMDTDIAVWCNSLVQFQFFACGMLVCLVLRGRLPQLPLWLRLAMQPVAFALWFAACYLFHAKYPGPAVSGISLAAGYALAAIGCILVIVGFLGFPSHLLPKPLIWLGKISFGLYVYHSLASHLLMHHLPLSIIGGPLAPLTRTVGTLALSILIAAVSYRYFESPFLRLKRRFEKVQSRPI